MPDSWEAAHGLNPDDGGDADDLSDGCNLMSWWDNLGAELFHSEQQVSLPPIPVDADGWGEEAPELRVVADRTYQRKSKP